MFTGSFAKQSDAGSSGPAGNLLDRAGAQSDQIGKLSFLSTMILYWVRLSFRQWGIRRA